MMQQIDQTEVEGAREFRAHLCRLQWDVSAFARAARIKVRTAAAMHRGDRAVPPPLMRWLESMVEAADQLPPPPATTGDSDD
jgi:hypothetical protein